LFSAATVVTGESQMRPGVRLEIAPALDDSEQSSSLSPKEQQAWRRKQPGDNGVSTNSRPLQAVSQGHRALLAVDPGFVQEIEPNGTFATTSPLGGTSVRVQANLFNGDIDFYSFTATAGDRVVTSR
jgi:hypothetical protein